MSDMERNRLQLILATSSKAGNRVCVPRITFGSDDESLPIQGFSRTHFFVRLCFGITAKTAQGYSFSGMFGLDFREHLFLHEQLYVALSTATHPTKRLNCLSSVSTNSKRVLYRGPSKLDVVLINKKNKPFSFYVKNICFAFTKYINIFGR